MPQKQTSAPQRWESYSITSSARASSMGGMVMPSVLAVSRFITSSNFVGCSMGRSAGFAPFRMASSTPKSQVAKTASFDAALVDFRLGPHERLASSL